MQKTSKLRLVKETDSAAAIFRLPIATATTKFTTATATVDT